jgi:hypothetical protein
LTDSQIGEDGGTPKPSKLMKLAPLLTAVGAVATMVALVGTVIALGMSIYQLKQSHKTEERIKQISDSVSTKYIGVFPENMNSINDLIASTHKDLWIIADVPAYGGFSTPSQYQQYIQGIKELAIRSGQPQGVRILTWDSKTRRESFNHLFGDRTIEQLREFDIYKKYFQYWKKKAQPKTLDDFYNVVESENYEFQRRVSEMGTDINETSTRLPVFLWLSDDKEAIFSFYYYGGNGREVSFRTTDPKLIQVLRELAVDLFRESHKYAATDGSQ